MKQSLKLFLAFSFFLISCKNNNKNKPIDDCNGDLGGIAFLNLCDVCVGGNTEIPEDSCASVLDIDGNIYNTIIIGNQAWMVENLKVTRFRDGTSIPLSYGPAWANLETSAFNVYYQYENNQQFSRHGNLYNWFAVNDSLKIAPEGWHIPTDDEWKVLEKTLGVRERDLDSLSWRGTDEGGKLKDTGFEYWDSPNTGATNETGFTAIPGGYLDYYFGNFVGNGMYCYFWTATGYKSGKNAWYRLLNNINPAISRRATDKKNGFSVRCVKD